MILLCYFGIHAWERRKARHRPERVICKCKVCGLTRVTTDREYLRKKKLALKLAKARSSNRKSGRLKAGHIRRR